MKFTDSHCHIDFDELAPQEMLLKQCADNGIHQIIVPSISPDNWHKVLKLCTTDAISRRSSAQSCKLHACLGIHPWFLQGLAGTALNNLAETVKQYRSHIIAIGEAGIDQVIVKEQDNLSQQIEFFEFQLDLAQQYNLPIIVHHRRSHQHIVPLLKKVNLAKAGIIHAFSGSYQQACQYIDLGFKLGIGGTITYPRAEKTIKAIKRLPLTSLALETDAPAMPLHGFQGQENSPLQLLKVFEVLAEIRPESAPQISAQLEKNIHQLFFTG